MLKRLVNHKHYHYGLIGLFTLMLLLGVFVELTLGGLPEFNQQLKIVTIVIIVILLGLFGLTAYSVHMMQRRLKNLRENEQVTSYRDVSEETLELPPQFHQRIQDIEALGFVHFAIIESAEKQEKPQNLWYWVNESYTIRVYFSLVPPLQTMVMGFISVMEDEAIVETTYNTRIQIDTDKLHVRNVTTSIPAAYDYHRQQLVTYKAQHGRAIAVKTSAELVELSNRFKQLYHAVIYEDRIENFNKYLILYAAMAIGFGLALLLSQWVSIVITFSLAGILMGMGIGHFIESTGDAFGSVEARKKKKNDS